MSAQETTPGHVASSAALTESTTGNPRAEPLFGGAPFSELITPGTPSRSREAVAALDEAVVEVEPGQAGVDAHVRLVRLDKHPLHDVVRVGARAVVVVLAQLRHAGAEMEAQQDGHHGRETRGRRESHLGASTVWPARSTGFIYRITNDEVHVVQ
jgi:hypothetical protein